MLIKIAVPIACILFFAVARTDASESVDQQMKSATETLKTVSNALSDRNVPQQVTPQTVTSLQAAVDQARTVVAKYDGRYINVTDENGKSAFVVLASMGASYVEAKPAEQESEGDSLVAPFVDVKWVLGNVFSGTSVKFDIMPRLAFTNIATEKKKDTPTEAVSLTSSSSLLAEIGLNLGFFGKQVEVADMEYMKSNEFRVGPVVYIGATRALSDDAASQAAKYYAYYGIRMSLANQAFIEGLHGIDKTFPQYGQDRTIVRFALPLYNDENSVFSLRCEANLGDGDDVLDTALTWNIPAKSIGRFFGIQ